MKLIDKSALVAEIDRRLEELYKLLPDASKVENGTITISEACNTGKYTALESFKDYIDSLEVKEVDLKKLGEIARHLIAVKENIEDMRLDSSEWNLLKRIGYPERFKAHKGE